MTEQTRSNGHGALSTIEGYLLDVTLTLDRLPVEGIARVVEVLAEARGTGRRVYIFGNGGSAATASHFACDLAKGAAGEHRPGLRTQCLNDSMPLTTAWANDTDYENVFSARLVHLAEPGDVVIAISGSGNSPNVLNGVKAARVCGATTIGLCGFDGGRLSSLVDIPIVVHNQVMEQVEDVHLLLGHVITTCLRQGTPGARADREPVGIHAGVPAG